MTGHVKSTVKERGFGFLTDPSGTDYFFHSSGLVGGVTAFYGLAEGDQVSFEPVDPQPVKGPRATNVVKMLMPDEVVA